MSIRTDKVASLVKHEVSSVLQRNFSMEEYGFITVTEVRMSPDLKIAKIYVSIFGDVTKKEGTLKMLEEQRHFIRGELGHNVRLKYTPTIQFYLDETLDHAMNIEQILHQIQKESPRDSKDE
ncbi:MAG: 30S ribosome-binding factor RbfA [Ignavibacteria bacterium]|nr:30S ribosome-binding factor RbfA [Ignavibacteria bacterium]